nr:hypothetical protein [Tanacetum cinerariifolium]
MSAHEDKDASDGGRMGSIRILNAIKAKMEVPKIGEWEGTIDLSMVPMDDIKLVLGVEYLDRVRAFPMPFANFFCIIDGGKTCMVSMERDAKSGVKTLLATQFKKGFNKSEPCYLAVTRPQVDEGSSKVEVPKAIEQVLEEFKDMMPKELPKKLPPRREVTIKNKYPIPLIANLFDQLRKARYFTKLDLRSGYYKVRIAEGDKAKTTCVTRYGSYELLVMPFGLTNALATFFTLMNKLFDPFLDKFVVVNLDDIVVNSHTLEEHVLHLKQDSGLMMDGAKIKAIQDWGPTKVTELRSFLSPVNYYRRLGYWRSSNARWTPIAFEGWKLNKTERKYTVQEKEMTAVVHCLRIWRHYLLGGPRDFGSRETCYSPKRDQLYVPKWGDLRRAILKECHDSKWVGHPRIMRTLALVEATYYWPRMGDNVETFVRTCLICQQDKIEQKKSGRLLAPLPMPKGPWESVSMDFITCLPKSEGGGRIIVVVDRYSKYGTFIAALPDVTKNDTAKLFFKNVAKLLDVAQFSYNMQRSEATWKSPFELVTRRQSLTPNALAASYEGSCPTTYKTMKEPFLVIGRVGKVSYRVQLPPKLKIHLVFNVSFLKPYHEDEEEPKQGVSRRPPTAVVTLYNQEVKDILSDRTIQRRGVLSYKEYLIKWRDVGPNSMDLASLV